MLRICAHLIVWQDFQYFSFMVGQSKVSLFAHLFVIAHLRSCYGYILFFVKCMLLHSSLKISVEIVYMTEQLFSNCFIFTWQFVLIICIYSSTTSYTCRTTSNGIDSVMTITRQNVILKWFNCLKCTIWRSILCIGISHNNVYTLHNLYTISCNSNHAWYNQFISIKANHIRTLIIHENLWSS